VRDLRQNIAGLAKVPLTQVTAPALNAALVEYEASLIERTYKFGVLLCRPGQTTEREWYQNAEMTPSLEAFMALIGERIALKGWGAYSGGLDVSEDRSGTHSYYTRCVEKTQGQGLYLVVMRVQVCKCGGDVPRLANVATERRRPTTGWSLCLCAYFSVSLRPQKVERKRFLGNDVCMIVFREEGCQEPFRPESIRSHFNHVFAVVEPDTSGAAYSYRYVLHQSLPILICTALHLPPRRTCHSSDLLCQRPAASAPLRR
jgi:hypothetical protein